MKTLLKILLFIGCMAGIFWLFTPSPRQSAVLIDKFITAERSGRPIYHLVYRFKDGTINEHETTLNTYYRVKLHASYKVSKNFAQ